MLKPCGWGQEDNTGLGALRDGWEMVEEAKGPLWGGFDLAM